MLYIIGAAHAIVILMTIAGLHILRKQGDIFLRYGKTVPVPDHPCTRCRLEHQLSLSVSIEVIYQKLGVMSSRPDVDSQIDPVQ
ncbi:hypothetical protein D3C76_1792580 [compost metagenome]